MTEVKLGYLNPKKGFVEKSFDGWFEATKALQAIRKARLPVVSLADGNLECHGQDLGKFILQIANSGSNTRMYGGSLSWRVFQEIDRLGIPIRVSDDSYGNTQTCKYEVLNQKREVISIFWMYI